MKKIFLLVAVITVGTIAYLNMGPEKKQYLDESDVQVTLKMDPQEKEYMDESDAQVSLNTEPEDREYMDESEVQAYLNFGLGEKQHTGESDFQAYTPNNRYHAVKHYKPRASTLGFSITPPPGSNWFEKLEEGSLYYVKINNLYKQYAILTEAREVRLSSNMRDPLEIQRYVKKEKEKNLASSKFKEPNLTVQVEESPSDNCVRYSQSYQDHGMKGLKGQLYVNVDTHGLFCLHPDNARVAIDMNYVEKSLSNSQVKSFSSEGERFLASLRFN